MPFEPQLTDKALLKLADLPPFEAELVLKDFERVCRDPLEAGIRPSGYPYPEGLSLVISRLENPNGGLVVVEYIMLPSDGAMKLLALNVWIYPSAL